MSLIPVKSIYDENQNNYYNPDAGHDSKLPGENENWLAIQKGFKAVQASVTAINAEIASLKERVTALENATQAVTNTETRKASK